MNRSVIIAAGILSGLILFFVIGTLRSNSASEADDAAPIAENVLPEALIAPITLEPHPVRLAIKGQTAPDKTVMVKSGTTGTVVSTPAQEGQYVKRGALLCGLDVEARNARLLEATAARSSAEIDLNAAKQLAAKGLTPANRVASAEAQFDAADAAVNAARIELSKTQIRAPFAGIFETRMAERGDFLSPGGTCGMLVDFSPTIVTVEVSEAFSGQVAEGMEAEATLAGGRTYPATVRYVARTADPRTRTFQVEATLDIGKDAVASGITTTLHFKLGDAEAARISPAILTLADDGRLGVRHVTAGNIVTFTEIEIIDDADRGVWVTGLPADAQIITAGQEYLSEGAEVKPIPDGGRSGQP